MHYSDELATISKPAHSLYRAAHTLGTIAGIVVVVTVMLGIMGLCNELAGRSARPRGWLTWLMTMAAAVPVGGCAYSVAALLDALADWLVHRRCLKYDYASNSYLPVEPSPYPYKERAIRVAGCLLFQIPFYLREWWRSRPTK
jgi:hypothetical protein